ncbi:hypothetical protein FB451DRAFT_1444164 [Mycena latifolia]|nr:hypothetical protein FB451DRAFT_1444164 [Mycena latifolia]
MAKMCPRTATLSASLDDHFTIPALPAAPFNPFTQDLDLDFLDEPPDKKRTAPAVSPPESVASSSKVAKGFKAPNAPLKKSKKSNLEVVEESEVEIVPPAPKAPKGSRTLRNRTTADSTSKSHAPTSQTPAAASSSQRASEPSDQGRSKRKAPMAAAHGTLSQIADEESVQSDAEPIDNEFGSPQMVLLSEYDRDPSKFWTSLNSNYTHSSSSGEPDVMPVTMLVPASMVSMVFYHLAFTSPYLSVQTVLPAEKSACTLDPGAPAGLVPRTTQHAATSPQGIAFDISRSTFSARLSSSTTVHPRMDLSQQPLRASAQQPTRHSALQQPARASTSQKQPRFSTSFQQPQPEVAAANSRFGLETAALTAPTARSSQMRNPFGSFSFAPMNENQAHNRLAYCSSPPMSAANPSLYLGSQFNRELEPFHNSPYNRLSLEPDFLSNLTPQVQQTIDDPHEVDAVGEDYREEQ